MAKESSTVFRRQCSLVETVSAGPFAAGRVLKDLENKGLIFAKGKTIVVFSTR